MAESLQRIIVRRALSSQHPTPFVWNGKRQWRERARLCRLGGSGAAVPHGYSIAN